MFFEKMEKSEFRTDTNDEHRSGRPKEVTTQEMINKIHRGDL